MLEIVRWNKSKKPTLEELQHMLDAQGLQYELYSDRPGTKYGRHKHPFDDFIVIVRGKMKLIIGAQEWLMKPGDRLDLPANTFHSAEMIGKDEVQYLAAAK
jgi:quercetin dioxygenase-like cupin family protein